MATQQELIIAQMGAVDNTQAAFNSVQRNIRRTSQQSKQLTGQLRLMRGGFGQIGHQVQDIAVQLSMGTNALIVFGQQGSQIASLFGPKGAVLGAFAAVAAAIGVVFMRDTKKAGKELETFGEKAIQAAKEVGILTDISRAFLIEIQRGKVNQAGNEYAKYKQRLDEATAAAKQLKSDQKALSGGTMTLAQSVRLQGKTVQEVNAEYEEQQRQITILAGQAEILKRAHNEEIQALRALHEQANPYQDVAKNAKDATESLLESIREREEREDLAMKARLARLSNLQSINNLEMAELIRLDKARQDAHDKEQERQNLAMESRLAALDNLHTVNNAEMDSIRKTAEAAEAAEERKRAAQDQTVSYLQTTLGNIASAMKEGSAEQKALLVAEQGMRVVSATMAAFDAANKAMAASGGNPIVGGVVLALGLANAAAIAGQAIASFEGGGMIPDGPRAGGVDGRGGRMAIVHPNEKITDMSRGGGDNKPVNISFNIQANDAAGFDELLVKRRALIVNMVNKAVNNSGRRSLT